MQRFFEWADSEISGVDSNGDAVVVRFAAALLHSNGQSHYSNGLSITLRGATIDGDLAHAVGRITSATLQTADARLLQLPVPSHFSAAQAPLRLALQMANGAYLQIDATSLQCDESAQACSVDNFQC